MTAEWDRPHGGHCQSTWHPLSERYRLTLSICTTNR